MSRSAPSQLAAGTVQGTRTRRPGVACPTLPEAAETRDAPQVSQGLHSMPGVAPSSHLPKDAQRHQGEDERP